MLYRQTPPNLVFIYLGFYVTFNTVQVISRPVVRMEEETIQLVKVLYCNLPTNSKQLPAFPLEVPSKFDKI